MIHIHHHSSAGTDHRFTHTPEGVNDVSQCAPVTIRAPPLHELVRELCVFAGAAHKEEASAFQ